MTQIVLPKLNQTGVNEWADVQDNDEAIKKVVNGELDNGNIAAGAGIALSKLAASVTQYVTGSKTVKMNFGITNVTSGAADGSQNVSHELGEEADFAIACCANGAFQVNVSVVRNESATALRLYAYRTDGANLGTVPVAWLAIAVN